MDKVNVVILAEETQYRVDVKNKIVDKNIAIVGYSDFNEDSRLKIEGYFPDVVVCALDNASIDENFFKFIQSINFQSTGCAVMIMTDKVSIGLVNDAAQIGIRQVVDFSIEPEDFCEKVKEINVLEQQLLGKLKIEKRVRSRVYSFYGCKGGVGTSTIVANTAVALANMGKKVLLLDLDLQYGDLNLFLDVEPKDTIVELARDPEGISIEKVNTAAVMHSTGLTILCAPKSPELADYVNRQHIARIIENVRPYYEYILIDLGANYEEYTLTAIENSDDIFMISNLDILSLRGLKCCANILDTLKVSERSKLIITKMAPGLVKVKDLENLVEKRAYTTISSDYRICSNSINSGLPFVTAQARSAIAKDFQKFVDRMVSEKESI